MCASRSALKSIGMFDAGRTIGSLCGQKLMVKIEAGKYRLTNPQ
jgi:hypothetical protein